MKLDWYLHPIFFVFQTLERLIVFLEEILIATETAPRDDTMCNRHKLNIWNVMHEQWAYDVNLIH